MYLDIKPFTEIEVNCIDNIVSNVMSWKKRNYEMSYSSSWDFSYRTGTPADTPLSDRIVLGRGDYWKPLELYHGLKMQSFYGSPASEKKAVVMRELKMENPVMINIDNYWCPWEKAGYQKVHSEHFCLIVGAAEDGKSLFCIDPVICEEIKELPADFFEKGCNGYITMRFHDTENLKKIEWIPTVTNAVYKLKNRDMNAFCQMKAMADELNESIEPEVLLFRQAGNMPFTRLFQKCTEITRGRYRFARLLKYLAEGFHLDFLEECSHRINDAGNRWMTFRTRVFTALKTDNPIEHIDRAADTIRKIAAIEEELADSILQFAGEYSEDSKASTFERDSLRIRGPKNAKFLDISSYCNNRGFAGYNTIRDGRSFDENGCSYFAGNNLPEEYINAGGMTFHFLKSDNYGNDNVSCTGQEIPVPSLNTSQIWVLGAAEYRDFSEEMEVRFSDGRVELVQLEFSHWWECISGLHETIAWQGNCIMINDGIAEVSEKAVYLFAKSLPLENNKSKVICIKLPECTSTHIFAITLL